MRWGAVQARVFSCDFTLIDAHLCMHALAF
jgi:hypothetical protein